MKGKALIAGLMMLIGGFWLPLLDDGRGFCQTNEERTAQAVKAAGQATGEARI